MAVIYYDATGRKMLSSTTTPLDHTHASTGVQGGQLTSPLVNEAVALTATATNLNLVDDTDFLPLIMSKGYFNFFPTNSGWVEAKTGSGTTGQYVYCSVVTTGITASSTALLRAALGGLSIADTGHTFSIDWSRKLYFAFVLSRENADTEAICRVQLKPVSTEGILADDGIGVQCTNFTVIGECYGSAARGTTATIKTFDGNNHESYFLIVNRPAAGVDFYVDGTLAATLSTANTLPAGITDIFIVHSIINGVTGGVDAKSRLIAPIIFQPRS